VFPVSSWAGGESLLDRENATDKALELKRRMSEMHDEEIDRGRVCTACLVLTETISGILIAATHGGMARLSGLDKYWNDRLV